MFRKRQYTNVIHFSKIIFTNLVSISCLLSANKHLDELETKGKYVSTIFKNYLNVDLNKNYKNLK